MQYLNFFMLVVLAKHRGISKQYRGSLGFRATMLHENQGSLKVLEEATIKFTNPKDFNDPFDCLPVIVMPC